MRIVQLSDTHISHLGGAPAENMSLLADHVNNEIRPDLVVHTGDVMIANPDSVIEDDDVRAELRQVPGLHGVSDVTAMAEFTAAMAEIESR